MPNEDQARKIFETIKDLTTEKRNPRTRHIDLASTEEILRMINREDKTVADAVSEKIPEIAKAVELVVASFKKGGRLFYFGAGTSGRLGVIDAAECPPTFGVDPEMVNGVIAGGRDTVFLSKEGIEDDREGGRRDVVNNKITSKDVVVGITASRRTPYVLAALEKAGSIGAKTVFLTCNEAFPIKVDVQINVVVGPEAIAGSTRLKAATAQKMILNMLTTASMIKLGKVYENLMVDLRPASDKLCERAKGIIMMLTKENYEKSSKLFAASKRNVKAAVVMSRLGVGYEEAIRILNKADGFLARALGER